MDLLEDLIISVSNSNFVMFYIIHEILVLLKSHLSYLEDNILECFLRSIIDFFYIIF